MAVLWVAQLIAPYVDKVSVNVTHTVHSNFSFTRCKNTHVL